MQKFMRKIGYRELKAKRNHKQERKEKEKKKKRKKGIFGSLNSDRNQNAQHLSGIKDEMIQLEHMRREGFP